METNGAAALPHDVSEDVKLFDESWLSQQQAGGARLTLLEPGGPRRMTGAAAELRSELAQSEAELISVEAARDRVQEELGVLERRYATEQSANKALLAALHELELRTAARDQRLRALECQLRVADAEANELLRAVERAEQPFWRKLLRGRT